MSDIMTHTHLHFPSSRYADDLFVFLGTSPFGKLTAKRKWLCDLLAEWSQWEIYSPSEPGVRSVAPVTHCVVYLPGGSTHPTILAGWIHSWWSVALRPQLHQNDRLNGQRCGPFFFFFFFKSFSTCKEQSPKTMFINHNCLKRKESHFNVSWIVRGKVARQCS